MFLSLAEILIIEERRQSLNSKPNSPAIAGLTSQGRWRKVPVNNVEASPHLLVRLAGVALKFKILPVFALALCILAFSPAVCAQASALPSTLGRSEGTGWIMIYLRGQDGKPLPMSAIPQISLSSAESTSPIPQTPRREGNSWVFTGLPTGTIYEVDVSVDGFQPASQTVEIPPLDGGSANAFFVLRPASQHLQIASPSGRFVLAPRVQKEVQKGIKDLDSSSKISSAQKHFEKAIQMAPGNPYLNYLMGESYLVTKQPLTARPYLEQSVSLDPSQLPSLLALGSVRFDLADYAGAIDVLEKALKLDPSSWKAEWLLSGAYLDHRDYRLALDHGEKALALGKDQAAPVKLVIAQASADLGDPEGALAMVNGYLSEHPQDANALKLRSWLMNLSRRESALQNAAAKHSTAPTSSTAGHPLTTSTIVSSPPAPELPPRENWAPPDLDTEKPFISSTSCSLPKVLKKAGKNAVRLVDELQEFTSSEEYQTVEIKRDETLEKPETRTFNYMAFIEQPRPRAIHVDEFRDEGRPAQDIPGELIDMGAPALVLAFHPFIQNDFSWSCEGLGTWSNTPAWVVRFEQLPSQPDQLLSFESQRGAYPIAIKGRAWISEKGGQVVHMETDLVKPVAELRLDREHFAIDYGPVKFKTHNVTLWLPQNVDVYYQYRGHFLHHYHHFSNFELFWTEASQKDKLPKPAA